MRNEIVLDLETTGLSPEYDRILEIAAVRLSDGEEFSCLVNPGIPVPINITEITGITGKMAEQGKDLLEALKELDHFLGKDPVIIGHNIAFDYAFLKVNFSRQEKSGASFANWGNGNHKGIDTLYLSKILHADRKHSLAEMTQLYGIRNEHAHRALSDTAATAELYQALFKEGKRREAAGEKLNWEKSCEPKMLAYKEKKEQKITDKQKKFLEDLIRRHRLSKAALGISENLEEMSRGEASRAIDGIISKYGKGRFGA